LLKEIKLEFRIPPSSEIESNKQFNKICIASSYTGEQMQKLAASYASKGQKREYGVDIIAEIQKHPNDLFVIVRAIDANVPNDNGDYFSDEELLKEIEIDGKKMPTYKTFEGCPVFSNHANDDIEKSRGKVIHAKWIEAKNDNGEDDKYVECLLRIDREAYPQLARGVEQDYICEVSMGCFLPGTRILTHDGFKNIEDITLDDLLVDADGQFTKVKNMQTQTYKGEALEVELDNNTILNVTPEHPILSMKLNDTCACGCGQMLSSKKFTSKRAYEKRFVIGHHQNVYNSNKKYSNIEIDGIEDFKNNLNNIEYEYKNVADFQVGQFMLTPMGFSDINIEPVDLNAKQARLIGYFIAEGSYIKYNDELVGVEFSLSINEKNTLGKEIANLISENFNLEAKFYEREDRNLIVVKVSSRELAEYLYDYCGEYSHSKVLDNRLLFIEPELQLELLGAWLAGDGYLKVISNPKAVDNISGCSTSRLLIEQFSYMLSRCGIYHTKHAIFDGNYYRYYDALELEEDGIGEDSRRIAYYIYIPSTYATKIASFSGYGYGNFTKINALFRDVDNKYILRQIKNIESKMYDGLVYNFETESNSYLAENCAVHNCQVDRSLCSICGNSAESQDEYCEHIKNYKPKTFTGQVTMVDGSIRHAKNESVYEVNQGIKFIEISWVADGACENCKKVGIIDVDSVLDEVGNTLDKAAQSLSNGIEKIHTSIQSETAEVYNIEDIFNIEEFTESCDHLVREINTLMEPLQILMQEDGGIPKEVIAALNKNAAQEDIDRLRAALSVMEDVARVILSRRESINLERLEDLASVMADLQDTIESLVDEGFGAVGVAELYPGSRQESTPQGSVSGQTPMGIGTITEPQMPMQQGYVNPAVSSDGGPREIPTGQLPIAAENQHGNHKQAENLELYNSSLDKIKEFSTSLKNANKQGRDDMINKREEETLDFSQKLRSILAERLQKQKQPKSSIELSVEALHGEDVYVVKLGENSFIGYVNDEEIQNWEIDSLGEELEAELYNNPEKVASQILEELTKIYQEGGGELMQNEEIKEKMADKADESIDHDVAEEKLLEESRDSGHKDVEHDTVEKQVEEARDPTHTNSVKDQTIERQLGEGSRDIAQSQSVMHDTIEKQQAEKGRDEEYTQSVDGSITEKQMVDKGKREDKKSPLLEKDLGSSRTDDKFDEYPGYTSEDGPAGPGWGKDTDFPTPKTKVKIDEGLQASAQISKDLIEALSKVVLDTETLPKTVIAATQKLLASEDSVQKIQTFASQERSEEKEKAEFFGKKINLSDEIFDSLASISNTHNVTEDSLRDFVRAILSDNKAEYIVAKYAKEKNINKEQKNKEEKEISKEAVYRMSFRSAFASDLIPEDISDEEIQKVGEILSQLVTEDISPEDVIGAAEVITNEDGEFAIILEESMTDSACQAREAKLARRAWRNSLGKIEDMDISEEILDKLAEYAISSNNDPGIIALAMQKLIASNGVETIKKYALERLSSDKTEETDKETEETEETEEVEVNIVAATLEEVKEAVDSEHFTSKAQEVLMKVLVEENNIDADSISIGEPQVDGECVYAAFVTKGTLEVEAQNLPYGMPMGMGMGVPPQGMPMPTAGPQMPQPSPGSTVPPPPGVNAPSIPTEGGPTMGMEDFDLMGEEFPSPLEDTLPGDLVPVEMYIRLPQGNIPVPMGGQPEMPMGVMPGAGMPMAATYRIPGDKILKTAKAITHRCPVCKIAENVDFEDSVGYCNNCNTPYEVDMKRDTDNNELIACVKWIQPHDMQEIDLQEDNSSPDDWWG